MTTPELHPARYSHQLEIVSRNEADGVTLTVRGEIDLASASALERELGNAESPLARRIVLDLAALDFIDSTGVHLLIRAQQRAEANGHQLFLTHVPAHAQRLFSLTGISARLSIE